MERLERILARRPLVNHLIQGAIFGVVLALYGGWQYHKGFDTGADSAICAFAIGVDGKSAITGMDACRRIKNHDGIVDGFKMNGTTP